MKKKNFIPVLSTIIACICFFISGSFVSISRHISDIGVTEGPEVGTKFNFSNVAYYTDFTYGTEYEPTSMNPSLFCIIVFAIVFIFLVIGIAKYLKSNSVISLFVATAIVFADELFIKFVGYDYEGLQFTTLGWGVLLITLLALVVDVILIAKGGKDKTEKTSNADELEKYKKLLDNGTITQEEFDAKKKQLLGL